MNPLKRIRRPGQMCIYEGLPSSLKEQKEWFCMAMLKLKGNQVKEFRKWTSVVWFPPGEKHWHGATATSAMTHIAIQEQLDGKVVDWLEKVSDEQYQA
jgi:hypothetical protein